MTIPNRELSQFGSFVYVNNSNQKIGIATTSSPNLGIGTADPNYKLHLVGDTNIDGNIYQNGILLLNPELQTWTESGGNVYRSSGNVGIGSTIPSTKLDVLGDVRSRSFISTVSSGTAPFTVTSDTVVTNLNSYYLRGGAPGGGAAGDIVTIDGSQTLTNKTLTSPTITSIVNSGAKTVPSGIGTFVITGSVGVVTSGMIADSSIVNSDISASASIDYSKLNLAGNITNTDINASAAIAYSKLNLANSIVSSDIVNGSVTNSDLANSTISGVSLGSSLGTLTFGTYLQSSGTSYNGSTGVTIQSNATSNNTSSTLVARDSGGSFSAGNVQFTGVGIGTTISGSKSVHIVGIVTYSDIIVSTAGTIGIGTNSPGSGLHMAGPNGYNIYLDGRRSDVAERQIIFDNGSTYCYLYQNKPSNPFGESFGWLDQSLAVYGSGANRNIFFYRPSAGTVTVGDVLTADVDDLKVGIGSTQPAYNLDVGGTASAKTHVSTGCTTSTSNSNFLIDASQYAYAYHQSSATSSRTYQVANLTPGRQVKIFIKNTAGASRTMTFQASETTSGFSDVRIADAEGLNADVNTIAILATDIRMVVVINMNGNFVGHT